MLYSSYDATVSLNKLPLPLVFLIIRQLIINGKPTNIHSTMTTINNQSIMRGPRRTTPSTSPVTRFDPTPSTAGTRLPNSDAVLIRSLARWFARSLVWTPPIRTQSKSLTWLLRNGLVCVSEWVPGLLGAMYDTSMLSYWSHLGWTSERWARMSSLLQLLHACPLNISPIMQIRMRMSTEDWSRTSCTTGEMSRWTNASQARTGAYPEGGTWVNVPPPSGFPDFWISEAMENEQRTKHYFSEQYSRRVPRISWRGVQTVAYLGFQKRGPWIFRGG